MVQSTPSSLSKAIMDSKDCDGPIIRQPKIFLETGDEDETPPGCEDLLFPSELQPLIASSLETYYDSPLIGLEYVVEVHPDASDDVTCPVNAFYICVLCEKRCDIVENILKHMESSAHRISYLASISVKLNSVPQVNHMAAIIGILFPLNYFRESPYLVYYDITSPFTDFEVVTQANNVKPGGYAVSQLDGMLANSSERMNSDTSDPLKKGSGTKLGQETAVIFLSDDDSLSDSDCEKVAENIVFTPTSQTLSERVSGETASSKIAQNMVWPLNPLSRSICLNNEEDVTAEKPSCQPADSDDDIVVEKEIFGKKVAQKFSSPRRTKSRSKLRSRSRSPKRSGISSRGRSTSYRSRSRSPKRFRPRSSSRDRNAVSKSRTPSRSPKRSRPRSSSRDRNAVSKFRNPSRSPKQLRSKFNSNKQQQPLKHQERHPSSTNSVRNAIGYEILVTQRKGKGRLASPVRAKQHDNTRVKKRSRLWKLDQELDSYKEKLRRKHKIYKERPEEHPLYAEEWKAFWKKRSTELVEEGKSAITYDFKPDWFAFWFSRMKKLDKELIKKKKLELEKKYGLVDDEDFQDNCATEKEYESESVQNRKPVQFGWQNLWKKPVTLDPAGNFAKVGHQTKNLPQAEDAPLPTEIPTADVYSPNAFSFEELRVAQNPKLICRVVGNTSRIPEDVPLPSGPNFLEVLRMLVALEDSLGSLGPSIMGLLTRALSSERREVGSSSKLLKEDPTCVDLLDTSKEKLKGLISAGFLDGVKGTAASRTIENVTRLLKQPSVTSHSSTSSDGPLGFNMASLISNLQAVGLLHPLQSTTILPSAIGSPSVSDLKDKDSTPSASNSYESHFEKDQLFNGEELKTLILNFRTLTAPQKRDLVKYLRRLEEKLPEGDAVNLSQKMSSSFSPSSPLSKKHRKYQSCKVTNPTAPAPPSSIRYPTIQEMTGLSCVDLKNLGIPLDELDSPNTIIPVDSRFCRGDDGISHPAVDNPYRFNNANRESNLGNPHVHRSIEKQPTDLDDIYLIETTSSRQHSFVPSQPNNESFYYHQLDPRRNQLLKKIDRTSPSDSLDSLQTSQDPVIIPISPNYQEKYLQELSSDPWQFNKSSKASSPLKGKGIRYW
ncbi:hypothetical protein DAPPUDRAFT_305135 [Daphnia pulex]|uniref:C2H2-type domain-containing protein n=1 Tax=Daphnia pulex TaxID=6669 RepID=E9GP56_DAPPU|nr:hypothetical protein DAPPUDRAFT_305135 [Daphnia pulex]|eukprot:EFX78737.1 hypothetical protein DAPPUDRAFT_305135 [Daphnia pulex]